MWQLEMYYLDVGQGDCTLITVSNNGVIIRTILIDCGSASEKTAVSKPKETLVEFLDYLGVQSLDIIVITHFDKDHFNGLVKLMQEAVHNNVYRNWFQNTVIYDQGEVRMPHNNDFDITSLNNDFYAYGKIKLFTLHQTYLDVIQSLRGLGCNIVRATERIYVGNTLRWFYNSGSNLFGLEKLLSLKKTYGIN